MTSEPEFFSISEVHEWLNNISKLASHARMSVDGATAEYSDRTGDYEKDIHLIIEGCNFLIEDYKKRLKANKLGELFK